MAIGRVNVVVLKDGGIDGEMALEESGQYEGVAVITYDRDYLEHQLDKMLELQRACVLQPPRKFFIYVHYQLLMNEPILFSALTWLIVQVQDRNNDDVIEIATYGIPLEKNDFSFWTSKGGMSYAYTRGDDSDQRTVGDLTAKALELGAKKCYS